MRVEFQMEGKAANIKILQEVKRTRYFQLSGYKKIRNPFGSQAVRVEFQKEGKA